MTMAKTMLLTYAARRLRETNNGSDRTVAILVAQACIAASKVPDDWRRSAHAPDFVFGWVPGGDTWEKP